MRIVSTMPYTASPDCEVYLSLATQTLSLPYTQAVKYDCPIFMYMPVFVLKSCMSYKHSMCNDKHIISRVRTAVTSSSNRTVITVTTIKNSFIVFETRFKRVIVSYSVLPREIRHPRLCR